jgi:hypothetical protein
MEDRSKSDMDSSSFCTMAVVHVSPKWPSACSAVVILPIFPASSNSRRSSSGWFAACPNQRPSASARGYESGRRREGTRCATLRTADSRL